MTLYNIEGYDEKEYFKCVKAFHALPDEIKNTMLRKQTNPKNHNIYRGYFPFDKHSASFNEMIDIGSDFEKMDAE